MEFKHTSVLLQETIENLKIKPEGIYVDGTLGGGGHASEIAERLKGAGRLIGIDQDADAMEAAGKRLEPYSGHVTLIRDNYCHMKEVLRQIGVESVDGIVLDLGVSSFQLDNVERGFSYKYDTPLDMRMDTRQRLSAKEIINDYSEAELYRIIRDYGEEQFAKNIAKHIAAARKDKPAIPAKKRAVGGHPAKRTFQAIRIECNRELEVLKDSLDDLIGLLKPGGRICIITFHSLEDRIVKSAFRKNENPCTCPPDFPVCVCGQVSQGRVITKKPILPSEGEMEANKRAKSAKLRVFSKTEGK